MSETFITPSGCDRNLPATVFRLPLSTELVHRNFILPSAGSYLTAGGYSLLQRAHAVLMTNLRFSRVELSEDVVVESSHKNERQFGYVVVVFENDHSQIVNTPTDSSSEEAAEIDSHQIAHLSPSQRRAASRKLSELQTAQTAKRLYNWRVADIAYVMGGNRPFSGLVRE